MPEAKRFELTTEDQFRLSATLFCQENKKPHLIIVASATGTPQGYYSRFANHLAEHANFDAVTFDYRGIGGSLHSDVKKSDAGMIDWGKMDLTAIIHWADKRYEKIFLVGHSVSGQIFPLASNTSRVSAAYFVASQSAYYGHWKGMALLKVLLFWYILVPLTSKINGFLPAWTMGGKVSLPRNVAREWKSFGTHPNGAVGSDRQRANAYASIRIPVHFLSVEGDNLLAPPPAVQALMKQYVKAKTTFQSIRPTDMGLKEIGHFGFFKSKLEKKFWSMPLMYFTQYVDKLG